jgi:hypothetical protein
MYENKFVSLPQNNKNNRIMKKKLFGLIGVLLTIVSVGCDNNDNEIAPNLTGPSYPIIEGNIYDEINDYFQFNYPQGDEYKCFFFGDPDKSQCLVFNKKEDIDIHFSGDSSFPDIDFDNYTLIVGQEIMPEAFYSVLRQELYYAEDKLILYVYIPQIEGGYTMVQHLFYWGLFPKMRSSNISVKIIKEQV